MRALSSNRKRSLMGKDFCNPMSKTHQVGSCRYVNPELPYLPMASPGSAKAPGFRNICPGCKFVFLKLTLPTTSGAPMRKLVPEGSVPPQ